jgi:hypothetical protein
VQAAQQGWPEHAIELAATVSAYLNNRCHVAEALALHGGALAAAKSCGDRAAEIVALKNLSLVRGWPVEPGGNEPQHEAFDRPERLGEPAGRSRVLLTGR